MKIQHTRMTFQANVLLLFLICAVVPLILNTSLNIVLYSVRLSADNRQKYDNVLSSLGNNIESHLRSIYLRAEKRESGLFIEYLESDRHSI